MTPEEKKAAAQKALELVEILLKPRDELASASIRGQYSGIDQALKVLGLRLRVAVSIEPVRATAAEPREDGAPVRLY